MFKGLVCFCLIVSSYLCAAESIRVGKDHLWINEEKAPFLFGAELQYFRARGGPGRNVARSKVIASWNKLLDRVHEANMNSVIFYIPWDFHEPVEGTFDFTGSLDNDKDGLPDYPSRDLKSFIKLVRSRGIKHIMIRPGPYINAEWGSTGFGAIPGWFLKNYPNSTTQAQTPGKPLVVSYQDPVFRDRTKRWFAALYNQVLQYELGPDSPIVFLQLDNETNYFWDSLYERDYSAASIERYRQFVVTKYGNVHAVSKAYGQKLYSLKQLTAPTSPSDAKFPSPSWHYDWFLFHDVEILDYYQFLRKTWTELGVDSKQVLFTSCDSFNAFKDGLLPRLDMRQREQLSFSTMNIYPKTYGTQAESTLNTPMKAAHDAVLMAASHESFYGAGQNWLMSTETVGGWFPPTEVSVATRQHTYGSLMASGVKALMIYYFHEGWNWSGEEKIDSELHFDAPLDKNMNPRPAFGLLKDTGKSLVGKLGRALNHSRAPEAQVLIAHETSSQYPVISGLDSVEIASTQSAAWFGLVREAGYAVDVGYVDAMAPSKLAQYSLIIWNPPGYAAPSVVNKLNAYVAAGGSTLSFVDPLLDAGPRVIRLPKNLAQGWNSDDYLKQENIPSKLAVFRNLMTKSGVKPSVEFKTSDGNPFVHVWTRKTSLGWVVAVENFNKSSRYIRVRINDFDPKVKYIWRSLFGGNHQRVIQSQSSLTVDLPVPADGIELWEVKAD